MQIKYQTTEDDYVAFQVFFSRHSSYAKRMRVIAGVVVPSLFFILFLSQAIYSHDWIQVFIGVVVCGGVALWILTGRNRWTKHFAKKIFKEGKNKGFLGVHELVINGYGILTKSEYGEGKIAWSGIERIGSTPDYTFIFTGVSTALIVPKSRVIEGDYDTFVAELKTNLEKSLIMTSTLPESRQANILVDQKPASCEDKRAGRHSGFGIASFILGLTLILFILLACIISIISCWTLYGYEKGLFIIMVSFIVLFLAFCSAFIGTGLGILGLLNKNRKRIFSIIGLILNLLIILGSMILALLFKSYFMCLSC